MRSYSKKITLTKNGRGLWTIDPVMGCRTGIERDPKGCFSDCYAARNARIYGYDFTENILRDFESGKHLESIIRKANKVSLPFIRMGNSGDPSEDWEHTIYILEKLKAVEKQFVIITRHWNKLTQDQLERIGRLNVCINTSISAVDTRADLMSNIEQYEKLKGYCKSILRLVSFDFNDASPDGRRFKVAQNWVLKNYDVLDTVFRCWKTTPLFKDGVINISETKFLGKKCYVSKNNPRTYFGKCDTCLEKCGSAVETPDMKNSIDTTPRLE
jgi:hypothetical protein